VTTGIFGGSFDPPHNGHVALVRDAKRHFVCDRFVILVAERPGHKEVTTPPPDRLAMVQAAFREEDVRLDPYERTIDMLRQHAWPDPLLLIGADQLADFRSWKEPESVLELARVGVATRPGFSPELFDLVAHKFGHPDRFELFEIEPWPVASRDLRARVARGEPIDALVPPAVAQEIEDRALYRGS
jgi:nicotinate-nucleotide adenylyltransferase